VCLLPAREPIGLAKQVASLDVLTGGRVVLGVGAGWNVQEIENHGVVPADRWQVMRERVHAMKAIWTQPEAVFAGQHVSFQPLWSWPKPLQQPHPPILVGGHGPGVLARVIDYGDEWLAMPAPGQPPLRERIAHLTELADAAGRERPAVAVQVYGNPPPVEVIERAIVSGADRIDLSVTHGSPEQVAEDIDRLGTFIAPYSD
jgi:probable F420-dependent oxidoreductase